MNKSLFYFLSVVLVIASIVFLVASTLGNKPREFLAFLIADIVLASLFLIIVKGWGIWALLGVLFVNVVGVWFMAIFSLVFFILAYGLNDSTIASTITENLFINGTRLVSLICPIVVLSIGIYHYEKLEEEKLKKSKKPKK